MVMLMENKKEYITKFTDIFDEEQLTAFEKHLEETINDKLNARSVAHHSVCPMKSKEFYVYFSIGAEYKLEKKKYDKQRKALKYSLIKLQIEYDAPTIAIVACAKCDTIIETIEVED